MVNNKMVKVSDLIAEFLVKMEVKVAFGIIGSANSYIFDSITKRGYTQIVCMHHEQAAVMAMGAYFRASGKISVAIVTAGAGSSNAITGVISNWADSIPGIIISGQEQTFHLKNHEGLRMYGIQGFNSTKMVKDVTKDAITILNENHVQNTLQCAYKMSVSGRPGPVWIDVPFDIQSKMVSLNEWDFDIPPHWMLFDAAPMVIQRNLDFVIKYLEESKRPIILGGHGIRLSGAKKEFRELVNTLQIPTILTWSSIDLLSEDNPYYFGRAGVNGQRRSNFIIQNSDFILVLGSRLSLLQTGYDINNFAPNSKIVLVDIDTKEWQKKHKIYKYFIQMDCKYFIIELQSIAKSFLKSDWIEYCNKLKNDYPLKEECHTDGIFINSYNFINEMCKYLHNDQIIVTDMGTGLLSGHYSMKLTENQTMFTSLGLGEMGYGLPGSIGAAFTEPHRQVLCLNCDGGMMMNLQELQTIIHHKLPIKIIIFNNDGYLMIKHTQKLLFNGVYNCVNSKTGVSLPDFGKIGQAFGFETYKINKNVYNEIPNILSSFFGNMNPAICEVFMDPEQSFLPKVKGVPQDDGSIIPAPLEEMSPLLSYEKIKDIMKNNLNEKSKRIKRI